MENHLMKALLGTALTALSISACLAAAPADSPKPPPKAAAQPPAAQPAPAATKVQAAPAERAAVPAPPAAPAVAKAAPAAAKEVPSAADPAPAMEKAAASSGEAKPVRVARKRSRETDRDARACLERPANIDIIRCAEKYL